MISFDVITVFPQLFTEHLNNLPFKKAVEKEVAKYTLWNLREYSTNKYGSVDDKTYGGGVGMLLMIEPIYNVLSDIYGPEKMESRVKNGPKDMLDEGKRIVLLSPRGERFTQEKARELSKANQVTFICGRYEGVDARVEENIATDVISIGDFVLSGGELPALTIMESVTRLLPGVLDKNEASEIESFSNPESNQIEYPQYTRPEEFMGLNIPEVLMSGNHKEIDKWRKENSKR